VKKIIKIGVVIPNRNESKNIADCIESLLPQKDYIEKVVLVDDMSTDNSIDVAKKLLKKFKSFKIIKSKKRLGAMGVLNEGIKYHTAEFLLFLASNDYAHPAFIKDSFNTLNNTAANPGILTAMCNKIYDKKVKIHNSPVLSYKSKYFTNSECDKFTIDLGNWITGSTTLFNRELLKKIKGFNVEYYGLSDLLTSIHLSSKKGAIYVPYPYGNMRMHKGFLYNTVTSESKVKLILNTLEKDKKSKIFKSTKFVKRMQERIIYSSIVAGVDPSKYFSFFSNKKKCLLSFFKILDFRLSNLKFLYLFVVIRPYDILSFFKYRYMRHFFLKIEKKFK